MYKRGDADSSDDIENIGDVDSGENEYCSSERLIEKRNQQITFKDSLVDYSRRLRRHYDARLSRLYTTASDDGGRIFRSEFRETACYISVTDYSKILIDIVLMWNELREDSDRRHPTTRYDFIRNLGKFLLLARKGYVQSNDYAWRKCVELHRELIVFSFLIISSQLWRGKDTIAIKLIIVNLLNTCSESNGIEIDDVVEVFLKKITQSKVKANPESMALLGKTISEYKVFSHHIGSTDAPMVREVDLDLEQGNYSYKRGYGFFFVRNVRPIRQYRTNNTVYELTLYHPGFDEDFKITGSNKIRALS